MKKKIISHSKTIPLITQRNIIIGILLTLLLATAFVYFIRNRDTSTSISQTFQDNPYYTEELPMEEDQTEDSNSGYVLGTSVFSFADIEGKMYIKHDMTLHNGKVRFPNTQERTMTTIYAQDMYMDPEEIHTIDPSNVAWTTLVEENIYDLEEAREIMVADHLFSFKQIPGTQQFLFAIQWYRNMEDHEGKLIADQMHRTLYSYNPQDSKQVITQLGVFTRDLHAYSYPKIDTFSSDGRYVSILLFGCWGCGGHKPETLLIDLQTTHVKNIGKVEQFTWKENGSYEYKDFIVVECEDPYTPDECAQDLSTLPVKSGKFE